MKMRIIIGVSVALVILAGTAIVNYYKSSAETDPTSGFQQWVPTATEVHAKVDTASGGQNANASNALAGRRLFAKLITNRFRAHDPPVAVLVKYHPDNWFALECPARMEPWNLDNLALDVWRESRDDLSISCPIMIYRTYIGAKPVLVGTLQPDKSNTMHAVITYDKTQQVDGAVKENATGKYANP